MAILSSQFLTLADWAKRLDPDGTTATVIDLLSQTNEMMDDMIWTEGNQSDGHRTTVRTGLPSGTWRMLYQGIEPSKSLTAQITDKTGNLEGFSTIDKDLADLNGNTAEFRLQEDAAFFEGLTQQAQAAFLYSNSINTPAQIMGLTPRYSSLTGAATGQNIIDAGGTGSTNTSIWLVGWGPNTVFGMFPKGKKAGLNHTDIGEETVNDANGKPFRAYRSWFKWEMGLCVRDWRYIVRIANIDVTQLNTVNAANLVGMLITAMRKVPTAPRNMSNVQAATRPAGVLGATKFAIYVNRDIATALDKMAMNGPKTQLTYSEWDGRPVTMFRGVPIRTVDQLLSTEARVV